MNTKQLDKEYIAGTYGRFPVVLTHGSGALVYDDAGREYIDLSTGIAVNTFGYCDPVWQEAVTAQLGALQHASNLYYTEPCARLAQILCERTGMKKVFFANSGAEANECAIKAARKYAFEKKGADCFNIITLENSFHGRTVTTLAATGQEVFHKDFLPLTGGFVHTPANDSAALEALVEQCNPAAIMFEVVQGEGGVMPLTQEFADTVARLCAERDILMIADEVQTGNGRTGQLYGYMNYNITPDIVTTAKGLGGGLPIGAAMLGEKVQDVLTPGSHGSTFGGNPVCCAGAVSILERIDEELLAGVREKSAYIRGQFEGADGIRSVSGMGLMLGIETERDAGEVIAECMEKGVLPIKAKNKVRLLPALNIPQELLEKAIAVIKEVCAQRAAQ